jgi:hypothetical protein
MATRAALDAGQPSVVAGRRTSDRSRPQKGGGGVAFGLTASFLLLGAILWQARPAPPSLQTPPAPKSPWAEIVSPIPIFDLPDTIFGDAAPKYQAWRARTGSGRRDVLTLGVFTADSPFLRLSIAQPRPNVKPQPFFSGAARQAAFAGLSVDRSAVPDGTDTRFGLLSVADVVLSQNGRKRGCLSFRALNPTVWMTGLACGAPEQPFGRPELVCALDRLDLLGGGADSALTRFFERSELARGRGCPVDRLAPIKPKPTWLDPGAALPKFETERHFEKRRSIRSAKL